MAAMDEFRAEREAVKHGTWKQKLSYFWEYYKWYVIIPVIIIAFISNHVYHLVTDPEEILHGVLLNIHNLESEESLSKLVDGFYEEHKIDTKEYVINMNSSLYWSTDENAASTNYQSGQALTAWIGAGSVDFMSGDLQAMTELAYKSYFADLSEVLTEEQYELYEPYFLYMDEAVIEQQQEAYDNFEDALDIPIPDCTKPEDMEKPIPVMIDMSQSEKLTSVYGDSTDTLVFCVAVNTPNEDMMLDFIDYLMK